MKIAILGWGSLLWEVHKTFDQWHSSWQYDGPTLKIEFSRVSQTRSGALTLVIDPVHGTSIPVAWCLSKRDDPEDAIRDLRYREKTTLEHIGRLYLNNPTLNHARDRCTLDKIAAWAENKDVEVVIWTDLPSNFAEKTGKPFSVPNAIDYLQALSPDGKAKAGEYIRQAPQFVQTPLRTALQQMPWFE